MTGSDLDEQVEALLRRADQRYTSGRRRLVAALQAGSGPLTITQLLEVDSSMPQSTVYRNLTILEEAGVATRIATNDEFARYELAEQFTDHHHHLICSICGDVADFSLDTRTEKSLDSALHRAADSAGFSISEHRLDLLGTCSNCSS